MVDALLGGWRWFRTALAAGHRLAFGVVLGSISDGVDESAAAWRVHNKRGSTAAVHRDLAGLLVDPVHMLAVLQRELTFLAQREIRVTHCNARRSKWRKSTRLGRCNVVYDVGIEVAGEPEREIVILGLAPVTPELRTAMSLRSHALRGHPWTAPFPEPAVHVEALDLMLLFFPLDPLMPGLAEITGTAGYRLLADVLPECRAGARIEDLECELVHYKPFDRAVIRIGATLQNHSSSRRTFYAKFYAEERECFRSHGELWSATRGATSLRLPEPLAYDAGRRMLVMSEAPGEPQLNEWIKILERGAPLPPGAGVERLERCARVAARALGELQRSGVRPPSRRTFRDDLERLKKDRDLLRHASPELAACADGLVERMEALAPVEERLVPAHGAYRHKQMIGDERSLTVIDWDGFTLANHALDAATFLARLRREPIKYPGSSPELMQMAAAFRCTFLEEEPRAARDLDLYEALQLTDEMLHFLRHPRDGKETAPEVRHLAAAVDQLLKQLEA